MRGIWLACLVSGIAGLSYELTYIRYLGHLFGTTTPAVAATIAVFFAGLALGAGLAARWLSNRPRPLLVYAGIEAAIGALGLALPWLFEQTQAMLVAREGSQSLGELLLASTVLLLPPTTLLGATFPAMLAVLRDRPDTTRTTARLYGLNTLGAVIGCLCVSLWWLPDLGLRGTTQLLAGFNLTIAAAMALAARGRGTTSTDPGPEAAHAEDDTRALPQNRAAVLAIVSGFVAIAIEVQWVRALALSFPATLYIVALVLSAYLLGIGLGSAAVGRLLRERRPARHHLLATYVLAGLGGWLALNLLPSVAPWSLERLAGGSITSFGGYLGWVGSMSVLCMLPATLAMGASLPVLIGLSAGRGDDTTTIAGRLYGLNTVGGVAGSLLGTFWLMPVLGLSRSLAVLALTYLVLALAVGSEPDEAPATSNDPDPPAPGDAPSTSPTKTASPRSPLESARRGLAALVALGALVVALDLQPEVNALRELPDAELLLYRDTPSGTVAVYEHDDDSRSLRINNQYTLSNTTPGTVAMQYRLGLVPMALHPRPERALLVGFATGTTLAAMASAPGLQQLDCVEIHDVVFELAPYFAEANYEVWQHPAVRLVEGDGRRHLARAGPRYDVIVEDLFVPRNPGVGALYSLEHFTAVRQRLQDDGVFVVWLPLWQLGPDELDSIIATFVHVFEGAEGWMPEHNDARPILGLVATVTESGAAIATAGAATLEVQFPGDPPQRATRVLDIAGLNNVSAGAPLNTLDRPYVELQAPRSIMGAKLRGESLRAATMQHLAPHRIDH